MPRVQLLATCLVDLFYPEVGLATVRVLRQAGASVEVPAGQTCCGLPLYNNGCVHEAAAVARRMLRLFPGDAPVIIPSGSCAWMVKRIYPTLFSDKPPLDAEARDLSARAFELSEYLARADGFQPAYAPTPAPAHRVTYHDSCHLRRGLGIVGEPRRLIRAVPGIDYIELAGADHCCGFGGTFSARYPEVATAITAEKLRRVSESGAAAVATGDCGCLLQLRGLIARQAPGLQALHLAELLAGEGRR
ncbi:MAG: (Fe-S)-binding protein [Deltaproteobacteria bacterium]|nr:(Fe-S)-binding protein [Deltaproteobacteria bacterium]